MHGFKTVDTAEALADVISDSEQCDDMRMDMIKRIVDIAQRRVNAGTALEQHEDVCVITTDWVSYASGNFGYDNNGMNTTALGIYDHERSTGKGADLFRKTCVIQQGWLVTGDGRKTQMKEYEDEDFDKASVGEFWVANGAQDYLCIVALDGTLVHDDPTAAEAM
jgi:hypothetical protein